MTTSQNCRRGELWVGGYPPLYRICRCRNGYVYVGMAWIFNVQLLLLPCLCVSGEGMVVFLCVCVSSISVLAAATFSLRI